jgi:putative phage-type endonuclease
MGAAYNVVCNGRDRAEWLKARRDGIGASDAAAVLGVNPYSSALEVYADKVGLVDSDDDPSEYARWGKILEPFVLAELRTKEPTRKVVRDGRLLRSRQRAWQMCTLDGRQYRRRSRFAGLVEVKTTKFDWERIPEDLWAQVQHQFAVSGLRWGTFAVWNRTTCEFHYADVEPEPDYIDEIIARETEFWEALAQGIPPAPDGSESSARALRAMYPVEVQGKSIDLSPELEEVADRLEELKGEARGVDREKKDLEAQIKAAIGDAEEGLLPSGSRYTYRTQERRETVQRAASFRVLRRKD